MAECSLIEENGRAHFLTKRFDRINGAKAHMQTLCGIAHFDYRLLRAYSYEQAFAVMRGLRLTYKEAHKGTGINVQSLTSAAQQLALSAQGGETATTSFASRSAYIQVSTSSPVTFTSIELILEAQTQLLVPVKAIKPASYAMSELQARLENYAYPSSQTTIT